MQQRRRPGLTAGVILVMLGVVMLAIQVVPGLEEWAGGRMTWPLIIAGFGAILVLSGYVSGQPGMVTGGCVVAGIGGILYWQNMTGDWRSWAYAWTLLPGFAGVGTILAAPLAGDVGRAVRSGLWQVLTSAMLFLIFSAFLGGPNLLGVYWPVLIILLGLIMLLRPLVRR